MDIIRQFETMPFDEIVNVIKRMDYRTIINLSQTSKEFRNLLDNRTIKKIITAKEKENLAGKMFFDHEDLSANLFIYLCDKVSNQTYIVSWVLYLSLGELQAITTELKSGSGEGEVEFENGALYYDENDLAYEEDAFSLDLNKTLFMRLLEEYEELLRTGVSANIYIRTDRSVDKILIS